MMVLRMGSLTTKAWPGHPEDDDSQVPPLRLGKPETWVGVIWVRKTQAILLQVAIGCLFSVPQTLRFGWDMYSSSLLRNWSNLDINSYLALQTGPRSEHYCWTCLDPWSFSVSREHSATATEKPEAFVRKGSNGKIPR